MDPLIYIQTSKNIFWVQVLVPRVAPGVANISIIGLVKMFSGTQGAEIGGGMVEDLSKNS